MVSTDEFQTEMNRLHRAFGAMPSAKDMDRHLEKLGEWFRIWDQNHESTSEVILKRMIDKAISDCERLPNFAQLKNLRQTVLSELPNQERAKTNCPTCDGKGLISALKNGRGYSFRCPRCENWQGKYDGLPLWETRRFEEGYEPVTHTDRFDPNDPRQIKGLALLKATCPNLYEKIIAKQPEVKERVEALGKAPPILKDIPSSGPEMPKDQKEHQRAQSLKQEAALEQDDDDGPF